LTALDDTRVRIFFAALPDASTRERTATAADALSLEPAARLVSHENYHVTLAFVGEVPATQTSILREIGSAQRSANFSLRFDACEYWPKPEVVVAVARAIPPALHRLWQELHRKLAVYGWALDPKRLRPHVTIAKKVSQAPVLQAMPSFEWPVREFFLMRSNVSGAHPAYTVVDTWQLLDGVVET